ncbi:MAG TPA: hypothetical protein PKC40_01680 [Saprospiraceae bacterium]|nr:hypothetical protein [Saprospiraceae bacterium]
MSVLQQLATNLGRRDEVPNQELAARIVAANDAAAVSELVENLSNKDKNIQSDCVKVLYEIGERKPELIAGHAAAFAALLDHKNNRMQWGAMTALDGIASAQPSAVFKYLPKILAAAGAGSVITKDHAVGILIKLSAAGEAWSESAFELLTEQLAAAATNQLPMYAENALPLIHSGNKEIFIQTLENRLREIEKESKRKRVEQVIKKAHKAN